MARLKMTQRKDGTQRFWILDKRDGVRLLIEIEAKRRPEALLALEQYKIRRDLEKEGYDDSYVERIADELFGPRMRGRHGMG